MAGSLCRIASIYVVFMHVLASIREATGSALDALHIGYLHICQSSAITTTVSNTESS